MSVAITQALNPERKSHAAEAVRSRPRVLHLITSFEIGGTERQAVELLKRLDAERYDVRLAAIRNRGPFYKEIESRFSSVPEFPLTSFYNANALKQLARLRRLLVREQIDILHAHDFYAGLVGAAAARLAGVRVIACQRHLKLSDRAVHRWGTRIIHALAHRVLVNSDAIRDYIIAEGSTRPDKIVVIKNGVRSLDAAPEAKAESLSSPTGDESGHIRLRREAHDRLCSELGLDTDTKLVGNVGRLQPVKGHRYFIEAAARVARDEQRTHFVLVGDGSLRGEIETQIARLDIGERVHLLGDRTDVARLVSAFDLMAHASLHEGLPNAVMEAMAAGVPVVATAVGGTRELIVDGKTGYLVPPADADALAERITVALKNCEERTAIAAKGREFVMARFGIERMIESVEKLYDELTEER
jgi:glycosyltransferase involved in cell wall biosynthesis